MSVLVLDCPHCDSKGMTFHVVAVTPMPAHNFNSAARSYAWATAVCENCDGPVVGKAQHTDTPLVWANLNEAALSALNRTGPLTSHKFRLLERWPSHFTRTVPSDLPADVERALVQAERIFALPDTEEPAAITYRRALELALKHRFPDLDGKLAARIRKATEQGDLPQAMNDWATEVRLVGNEGAHDEGVSHEDVADVRNFVDALLRYLYSFPAMVESRRLRREVAD